MKNLLKWVFWFLVYLAIIDVGYGRSLSNLWTLFTYRPTGYTQFALTADIVFGIVAGTFGAVMFARNWLWGVREGIVGFDKWLEQASIRWIGFFWKFNWLLFIGGAVIMLGILMIVDGALLITRTFISPLWGLLVGLLGVGIIWVEHWVWLRKQQERVWLT